MLFFFFFFWCVLISAMAACSKCGAVEEIVFDVRGVKVSVSTEICNNWAVT